MWVGSPSGSGGPLAISTELPGLFPNWRFGPTSEADFEPLLALRIDVMREHLERVFRYKPSRARRIFRQHFEEPGMRLILMGDERVGCVGFRDEPECLKIDSFYLERRFHNSGLGTAILKADRQQGRPLLSPPRLRQAARGRDRGRVRTTSHGSAPPQWRIMIMSARGVARSDD